MLKALDKAYIQKFIETNEIPINASQYKMSVPIINRICRKMNYGIKFDDIKICGDIVIDGHHRHLSSLIMNVNIGSVSSEKTAATVSLKWWEVEFDEKDWDTESKILHLNEMDAKYNDLDIEILKQLTSNT